MTGRLYDLRRWRRASRAYLQAHPLCVMCEAVGRTTLAVLVDHIEPVAKAPERAWDEDNWQPLCATCHSGAKASFERTGRLKGCDVHGRPLDPNHHWNQ